MSGNTVKHLVIRGRVQGVGFRYSMREQAQAAGVTGWVRNRRDGTVEAMVAGEPVAVERMLAWARIGPAGGSVSQVIVEDGAGQFASFEMLATV